MSLNQAFASMFTTRSIADDGLQSSFDVSGFPFYFSGEGKSTLANERTSLSLTAFFCGVNLISNDLAWLPKEVFQKKGDQTIKYSDHPVNYLIANKPNDLMNAFDFWKIIEYSKIVKGNAFAEIIRNKTSGKIESLIFRYASDVSIYILNDKLYYKFKNRWIASADMLHFKGFSFDGIVGVGVITFAAKQLGLQIDAQNFQQEVYKDRGLGYGVIESDGPVNKENKMAIENSFSSKMASKDKFKVPVLDAGLKYKSISITPAEAQFLETNRSGLIAICQLLGLAPHKLKDLTNANYSNIYQQSIEHVQECVLPRVESNEQELNNKLFSTKENGVVYTKFNTKELLRGDLLQTKEFFTAAINYGWMSPNEVRAREGLNPMPGLDEYLRPVNMQTIAIANQNQNSNGNSTK